MLPHDFVGIRIRTNLALEIYVIVFLDVIRIHILAELQMQNWNNCNEKVYNVSLLKTIYWLFVFVTYRKNIS